jgi:hypothetical protein
MVIVSVERDVAGARASIPRFGSFLLSSAANRAMKRRTARHPADRPYVCLVSSRHGSTEPRFSRAFAVKRKPDDLFAVP